MLLFLALSASSFVCPPLVEETKIEKTEGQQCGGVCDSFGLCAAGLECFVEKPKLSSFSFAILSPSQTRAGVCRPSVAPVDAGDDAGVEGRGLLGGERDANLDSEEILSAAKAGLTEAFKASNSLSAPPTLKKVLSASQQVVAGIKYSLEVQMSDGSRHRLEVLDQAWMSPRYTLLRHQVMGIEL